MTKFRKTITCTALAVAAAGAVPAAAQSAAPPATLSGSCQFSGTILPEPPITLLSAPSPHFSLHATGSCTGTLDGTAVSAVPTTLDFSHASTPFDTCELGLDLGLTGTMTVRSGTVAATFPITINMLRLAVAGPLLLSTPGSGAALGTALFTLADPASATACAGAGVAAATLSGSFTTVQALTGTQMPAAGG